MREIHGKATADRLEDRLVPSRTALLVVDMQNDFCSPGGMIDRLGGDIRPVREIIPTLARLVSHARRVGTQIVYIKNRSRPDGRYNAPSDLLRRLLTYAREDDLLITTEGSWGEEVIPELETRPDDLVVVKHRPDAYQGTPLDLLLRSNGIANVVITGTATFACVESTARRALMEDYYVTIVEDCVAATDPVLHEASIKLMRAFFGDACVVSSEAVMNAWRVAVPAAAPNP
jgi:nicotinamidase-related amidase